MTSPRNLFSRAIYLNASPERLLEASRGTESSEPIEEGKRWVTGRRLLLNAHQKGYELPLIFGYEVPPGSGRSRARSSCQTELLYIDSRTFKSCPVTRGPTSCSMNLEGHS